MTEVFAPPNPIPLNTTFRSRFWEGLALRRKRNCTSDPVTEIAVGPEVRYVELVGVGELKVCAVHVLPPSSENSTTSGPSDPEPNLATSNVRVTLV